MTGPDEPRDEELPPTHQPYGQGPPPPPQPGQAPWSPPPPPQSPYAGAPAYGYGAPRPPMHPQATTAMVLGIASVAGLVTCQLLLVLGPVAWVMGSRACQEMDAAPGRWQGRDQANAGRIMGIIATVLLVLGVLAIAVVIVSIVAFGAFGDWDSGSGVEVNALAALAGLG